MEIITTCPFCGEDHIITVQPDDYFAWQYRGVLIQDAFPYLNANEREMLKTGICPTCWEKMFS